MDSAVKDRVVKKVQDTVLSKWQNEPNRIDKRALSLIYMAHASDVLENAFAPLSGELCMPCVYVWTATCAWYTTP